MLTYNDIAALHQQGQTAEQIAAARTDYYTRAATAGDRY